ncbi:MAG: nucleotidyl transferase AbiEii/AbiGii toxin family protein [Verrucomicrobia bacterium]|nr:nucleotidyl transferase AbiEii/AbiGii toxin family protein [Verrucomicrobiota bacterium]
MSLKDLFESAVTELRARNVCFAVAGGFAAGLYRLEPRLTMDVDLIILTPADGVDTATDIIEAIGLKAGVAREADLAGGPLFAIRRKNTKACMVVGRPADNPQGEGVDILLCGFPWVEDAARRAQGHEVDFGFGPVPVLTLEDVLLAKLWALRASPLRAKDLDDLQSIIEAKHELDIAYLAGQIGHFKILVPREAEPFLPAFILQLSRDARRSRKSDPNAK